VNDVGQAEILALPLVALENAGVEIVKVVRGSRVQQVVNFEIDPLKEVDEDPAVMAVDEVLESARNVAGLGLGFDLSVDRIFDLDLHAGLVGEAGRKLARHEGAVACGRLHT
jgi:hypothetical protein